MASSSDFELIHGQLHVTKDPSKPELLGRGPKSIHGATYMQSPTVVGVDTCFKTIESTLMVGPIKNTDCPFPKVCDGTKLSPSFSLSVCGEEALGNPKGSILYDPYSLVVRTGQHITRNSITACSIDGAGPGPIAITESDSAALFIGDVDIDGYTRVSDKLAVGDDASFGKDVTIKNTLYLGADVKPKGNVDAEGEVYSNCRGHKLSAKKNFDIPHPTKEGWRLTHTCVEGPEAAVYIRGRIRNRNEIHLPDYWKGLVNINTITINLTPIGAHQDVIIKRWDDSKVYLQAKGGMPIDCFYHIMAERKDTEKLIPEYPGNIENYPGDNSQRSIAGYHYDIKE